jgi:hypothetical protein
MKRMNKPTGGIGISYCYNCRCKLSKLFRIFRRDGYCSSRCRKVDLKHIEQLAFFRLHTHDKVAPHVLIDSQEIEHVVLANCDVSS